MSKFRTNWFCAPLMKHDNDKVDPRIVDLETFATYLEEAYEEMDAAGYDVINVVPIAVGGSESVFASRGEYVGETGYAPTRAAVIIGKKKPPEGGY